MYGKNGQLLAFCDCKFFEKSSIKKSKQFKYD